jgi:GNAT superfamily N-acetyltransferase
MAFAHRPSPTVREPCLYDADEIAKIQIAGWRTADGHILSDRELRALDAEEATTFWQDQISSSLTGELSLLVSESDGEVSGFSSFGQARDHDLQHGYEAELYALYIRPGLWGQGAGQALMNATRQAWTKQDLTVAALWVFARNGRARRFYEESGWVLDSPVEPRGDDHKKLEVRYQLPLTELSE